MSASDKGREYIEHYGVKGMRWGVRRGSSTGGRAAGEPSADFKRHRTALSKSKSELSDQELRDLTNRLNTEQQLARLTGEGQSAAKKVLASVGTANAVIAALKSPAAVAAIGLGASLAVKLIRTAPAVRTIGQF